MSKLILYELKKILSWRAFIISGAIVFLLPLIYVFTNIPDQQLNDQYDKYEGVIDEEWLGVVQKDFEQYSSEQEAFYEDSNRSNTQSFMYEDEITIAGKALLQGSQMLTQEWVVDPQDYSNEFVTFVNKEMNKSLPKSFGDDRGGEQMIWTISYMGILFGGFISFLMARIFNCENQGKNLIKTTKMGKYRVAIAKIIVVIGVPFLYTLLGCIFYLMVGTLVFNPDYSVQMFSGGILSPQNFGEGLFDACVIMLIGVCACSMIAATLSSLIKSSFASLAMTIFIFCVPLFLQSFEIGNVPVSLILIPSNFMFLNHSILTSAFIDLFDQGLYFVTLISSLWTILILVLTVLVYRKYQHRCKV